MQEQFFIGNSAFEDTNFSKVYFLQADFSKIIRGMNIFAGTNDEKMMKY